MRKDMIAAVGMAAALGLSLASGPVLAGDRGCRSGECYEQVRQPDVYGHVERPVVIQPGYAEVNHYPPAIMNRVRAIEVVPGSFNVVRQPAMYGSYTRTEIVAPSRTMHSHVPASYKVVPQREVVRPAQVRWEYQRDAHGRLTKCKVVTPAITRTVMRSVMVSPARTVAHVSPARYRQVQVPMLVQPARVPVGPARYLCGGGGAAQGDGPALPLHLHPRRDCCGGAAERAGRVDLPWHVPRPGG